MRTLDRHYRYQQGRLASETLAERHVNEYMAGTRRKSSLTIRERFLLRRIQRAAGGR